jgi:hypothetical protein
MNIQSTINYCLGLNYRDLENFAGENYLKIYNSLKQKYAGEKINTVLIGSIFTCVASDGKLTDAETKFIQMFIGGYSYDSAFDAAKQFYNAEAQNTVRDLYKSFSAEIKDAYANLCIAVLAVDKNVTDMEKKFLFSII